MTRAFIVWVFTLYCAVGCSDSGETVTDAVTVTPSPEPAGIKVTSQHGDYALRLAGADTPLAKDAAATLDLTVRTGAGAPASGLTFDATFVHTVMGHGSGKVPEVTDGGEGKYTVSNVLPSMTGHWKLELIFPTADGDDTAAFALEVK